MDFARLTRGDSAVIVGTSGFAVELAGLLRGAGITVHGCLGPEPPPSSADIAYLGGDELASRFIELSMVVAVGQPKVRRRLFADIGAAGGRVASFIHPAAYFSPAASTGEGILVYPNATVHAGVLLGKGALVNSNATIGHETVVGAFANINPGASIGGRVTIGEGAYIGIGASVIEEIEIAPGTIVGAGAVVVRDCEAGGTYFGVPARRRES